MNVLGNEHTNERTNTATSCGLNYHNTGICFLLIKTHKKCLECPQVPYKSFALFIELTGVKGFDNFDGNAASLFQVCSALLSTAS